MSLRFNSTIDLRQHVRDLGGDAFEVVDLGIVEGLSSRPSGQRLELVLVTAADIGPRQFVVVDGRARVVLASEPIRARVGGMMGPGVIGRRLEVEDVTVDTVITVDQAHTLTVVGGARALTFELAAAAAPGSSLVMLRSAGGTLSQGFLPQGFSLVIGDSTYAAATDAFVRAGALEVSLTGALEAAHAEGLAVGIAAREAREYPAALVERTDSAGDEGVASRGARLLVPRAPGVPAPRVGERGALTGAELLKIGKVSEEVLGYVVEMGVV